ncbi:ComEA family DNA-binding protein [Azospirillum sp. sgz301742]
MDIDKKTIAGAAAAVAAGVAGAVAYTALKGKGAPGDGKPAARPPKGQGKRKHEPEATPEGPINLNKAAHRELMALKHIGKARAKRILHARPFRSVDDLVNRGLVPADVLAAVRDRLTV